MRRALNVGGRGFHNSDQVFIIGRQSGTGAACSRDHTPEPVAQYTHPAQQLLGGVDRVQCPSRMHLLQLYVPSKDIGYSKYKLAYYCFEYIHSR
jgi:hypothetical protein